MDFAGSSFGGSVSSGQFRIRRAWQAGQWARAVLDQRASSPNRSEPLDLRCRFYAVLRCEGLDCPVVFRSPGSYWSALGSFSSGRGASSVSHAFASECEALVYFVVLLDQGCGALCSHMARWRRAGWNLGSKGPRSSPPERWTFVGCSQPRLFEVPGVVLDGGRLNPTGSDLQCLVVDFQSHVVDLLRPPQSFENIAFSFDPDQPYALPDPGVLLLQVLEWIQSAEAGSGLEFYAAEGGLQGCSEDACQKSKSHAKARRWMPGPRLAPSAVVSQIQTPPRTSHAKNPGLLLSPALAKLQELLELEKEKPGSAEAIPNDMLAQAVLAQSTALNNLVSQIAQSSSDPMVDLGGLSVAGTRGSSGRARLQTELVSQKGLFFQSVMQAMARRMPPTVPVDGGYRQLMDGGMWHKVFRAFSWLLKKPGFRHVDVPGHDYHGLPSNRELECRPGCHGAPQRHHRAGSP